MSKRGLGSIAILLTVLIAIVLAFGFGGLPRELRGRIDSERRELSQTAKQFEDARAEVTRDLQTEPALFRARGTSVAWPDRLAGAAANLALAQKDMAALARLRDENHSGTKEKAERLLLEEKNLRTAALSEASGIRVEANRWLDLKRNLPRHIEKIEQEHKALQALDLSSVAATVQKAETDWPEKKADLDGRLTTLRSTADEAEKLYKSTEAMRRAGGSDPDYEALQKSEQALEGAATALPDGSRQLTALTGQLYDSWDKVLVDLEVRRAGESRDYNEKIKTVRTHLIDVAGKKSETTSEEKWMEVPQSVYHSVEDKLGMTLEHKSAGKYDSEAERVAQPAGFAYVAPPTQASNQYGYWEHRDGNTFWTFFPQYLLMRELLWAHQYHPPSTIEYQGYRTAQSTGQTYYGHDTVSGTQTSAPKYGTHGTFTQSRYAGSQYVRNSGTYSSSRYATQGGTYRGSQYESHGSTYRPGGTTFGSRTAPRSMPSAGRRFGGRRR